MTGGGGYPSDEARKAAHARRANGAASQPRKVPFSRSKGPQLVGTLAKVEELNSTMDAGADQDEAVRVARERLATVTVKQLRTTGGLLIAEIASRLMRNGWTTMDSALGLAEQAVRGARMADGLSAWRGVAARAGHRSHASEEARRGYQEALDFVRFNLDNGKTFAAALQNDRKSRADGRRHHMDARFLDANWQGGADAALADLEASYREVGK